MPHNILIVEDNETNRRLMRDVLMYYGYKVIEAVNGEEGMRIAKEQTPDLVLMDIQMPVMDGLAAIKMLKNDPETKGIKIVAVTSFAMKGDKEEIMEAGFDGYIAKPVDIRELPGIIQRLLF